MSVAVSVTRLAIFPFGLLFRVILALTFGRIGCILEPLSALLWAKVGCLAGLAQNVNFLSLPLLLEH